MTFSLLVGASCGQRGSCTFYKSFKYLKHGKYKVLTLGEFFFVNIPPDNNPCIGELCLLWEEKNTDQGLSCIQLYFLPEQTPEGRKYYHDEHEVLAASEKVILRLEDLTEWITEEVDWSHGLAVGNPLLMTSPALNTADDFGLTKAWIENSIGLDVTDVRKKKEMKNDAMNENSSIIVLSYAQYCRYRAVLKRLNGCDRWFNNLFVVALQGICLTSRKTMILFCRDTFDHDALANNDFNQDHLVPKMKGRPRKRKILVVENNSPSSDSEGCKERIVKVKTDNVKNGIRKMDTKKEQDFLQNLFKFMKERNTPIHRVPHLGFKQIDLFLFYTCVQKLGGYEKITSKKLWKNIYDKLGGIPGSTSAATCTRKHYERLLLPFEKNITQFLLTTTLFRRTKKKIMPSRNAQRVEEIVDSVMFNKRRCTSEISHKNQGRTRKKAPYICSKSEVCRQYNTRISDLEKQEKKWESRRKRKEPQEKYMRSNINMKNDRGSNKTRRKHTLDYNLNKQKNSLRVTSNISSVNYEDLVKPGLSHGKTNRLTRLNLSQSRKLTGSSLSSIHLDEQENNNSESVPEQSSSHLPYEMKNTVENILDKQPLSTKYPCNTVLPISLETTSAVGNNNALLTQHAKTKSSMKSDIKELKSVCKTSIMAPLFFCKATVCPTSASTVCKKSKNVFVTHTSTANSDNHLDREELIDKKESPVCLSVIKHNEKVKSSKLQKICPMSEYSSPDDELEAFNNIEKHITHQLPDFVSVHSPISTTNSRKFPVSLHLNKSYHPINVISSLPETLKSASDTSLPINSASNFQESLTSHSIVNSPMPLLSTCATEPPMSLETYSFTIPPFFFLTSDKTESTVSLASTFTTEPPASLTVSSLRGYSGSLPIFSTTDSLMSLSSTPTVESFVSVSSVPTVESSISVPSAPTVKSSISVSSAPTVESSISVSSTPTVESSMLVLSAPRAESSISLPSALTVESSMSVSSAPTSESSVSVPSALTVECSMSLFSPSTVECSMAVSSAPTAESSVSVPSAPTVGCSMSLFSPSTVESSVSVPLTSTVDSLMSVSSIPTIESSMSVPLTLSVGSSISLSSVSTIGNLISLSLAPTEESSMVLHRCLASTIQSSSSLSASNQISIRRPSCTIKTHQARSITTEALACTGYLNLNRNSKAMQKVNECTVMALNERPLSLYVQHYNTISPSTSYHQYDSCKPIVTDHNGYYANLTTKNRVSSATQAFLSPVNSDHAGSSKTPTTSLCAENYQALDLSMKTNHLNTQKNPEIPKVVIFSAEHEDCLDLTVKAKKPDEPQLFSPSSKKTQSPCVYMNSHHSDVWSNRNYIPYLKGGPKVPLKAYIQYEYSRFKCPLQTHTQHENSQEIASLQAYIPHVNNTEKGLIQAHLQHVNKQEKCLLHAAQITGVKSKEQGFLQSHTSQVKSIAEGPLQSHTSHVNSITKGAFQAHKSYVNSIAKGPLQSHTSHVNSITKGPFQAHKSYVNSIAKGPLQAHTSHVNNIAEGPLQSNSSHVNSITKDLLQAHTSHVNSIAKGPLQSHTSQVNSIAKYPLQSHTSHVNSIAKCPLQSHTSHVNSITKGPFQAHKSYVNSITKRPLQSHTPQVNSIAEGPVQSHTSQVNSIAKDLLQAHTSHVNSIAKGPLQAHTSHAEGPLQSHSSHANSIAKCLVQAHTSHVNSIAKYPLQSYTSYVNSIAKGPFQAHTSHENSISKGPFQAHKSYVNSIAKGPLQAHTSHVNSIAKGPLQSYTLHAKSIAKGPLEAHTSHVSSIAKSPLQAHKSHVNSIAKCLLQTHTSHVNNIAKVPLQSPTSHVKGIEQNLLQSPTSHGKSRVQGPLESPTSHVKSREQGPLQTSTSHVKSRVQGPLEFPTSHVKSREQGPLQTSTSHVKSRKQGPMHNCKPQLKSKDEVFTQVCMPHTNNKTPQAAYKPHVNRPDKFLLHTNSLFLNSPYEGYMHNYTAHLDDINK